MSLEKIMHWIQQHRIRAKLTMYTGWMLYFYSFTHLLNHSLGIFGLDVLESGRQIFVDFWRLPVLEWLVVKTQAPVGNIFSAVSITFFAYTGFGVISNTAEDIADPKKNLLRAMMTAISLVMMIYVMVALVVFGNIPANEVIDAKDYALAEAAKPLFGQIGFKIMAVTALISTASAINANLYSVTNVTYQLVKDGELPTAFGKPFGHSREGMLISLLISAALVMFFDLGQIAMAGSLSVLLVHAIMHIGHLRLIRKTGASVVLVAAALIATLGAALVGGIFVSRKTGGVLWMIGAFILASFIIEILFRIFKGREVRHRVHLRE